MKSNDASETPLSLSNFFGSSSSVLPSDFRRCTSFCKLQLDLSTSVHCWSPDQQRCRKSRRRAANADGILPSWDGKRTRGVALPGVSSSIAWWLGWFYLQSEWWKPASAKRWRFQFHTNLAGYTVSKKPFCFFLGKKITWSPTGHWESDPCSPGRRQGAALASSCRSMTTKMGRAWTDMIGTTESWNTGDFPRTLLQDLRELFNKLWLNDAKYF